MRPLLAAGLSQGGGLATFSSITMLGESKR